MHRRSKLQLSSQKLHFRSMALTVELVPYMRLSLYKRIHGHFSLLSLNLKFCVKGVIQLRITDRHHTHVC